MAYETVKRNEFDKPDPARLASRISEYHSDDVQDFHLPLERMHNSNLHDWGIARGLDVSGTIGGTEIIVHSGVAIDRDGQLISLSELGEIHENPSEEQSEESIVPVHLSTGNHAGKTVYVTIQFFERLRPSEGVLGMLEQVPWVRLQPVEAYDSKSIVLAIAVLKGAGILDELKTMDKCLPHCRRLIGETIEELRIQRSSKIGNIVKEIPSGKIGPGDGGGLRITVPNAENSILFAREKGRNFSNFSNLEIRSEKLEVNGTVKADKFVGDGSGLTKTGQWTDVDGGISYNAGKVGIGTTIPSAKLEVNGDIKANANLVINGNVGIGTTEPLAKLEVNGDIKANSIQSRPATHEFTVGGNFEEFYPIIFDDINWSDGPLVLEINRPNTHTNSQWRGSLNSRFTIHSTNWGHGSDMCRAEIYSTTPFIGGYKNFWHRSKFIVWLKGGGTTYYFRSNHFMNLEDSSATAKTFTVDDTIQDFPIKTGIDDYVLTSGIHFDQNLIVDGLVQAKNISPPSDARFKTDIIPLTDVLDKLEKIRGVSFKWNELYPYGRSESGREIGLIAQEVEEVFPELITIWGDKGYRGIDYNRFTGVLLEAIKELKAEIEELKKR